MPAAHNSPGFVSFANYLDANAGSLDTERNAALAAAQGAGDTARTDLTALGPAAFAAGAKDAEAEWNSANPNGPDPQNTAPPGFAQGKTFADSQPLPAGAGAIDVTSLDGYKTFIDDRQKALDASDALTDPSRAADKYSPFESGLINASTGYQTSAKGIQDQNAASLSDYLDGLQAQARAGAASYRHPFATPVDNTAPSAQGYTAGFDDSGPRDPKSYAEAYPGGTDHGETPTDPGSPDTDDSGQWGSGG